MNRTRTLLVIGVFMLSLAVLAALEFRVQEEGPGEGQMVTGSLSKDGPALPKLPSVGSADGNGVLVPLDNGTLRSNTGSIDMGSIPPDEETPAGARPDQPAPVAPVASAAGEKPGEIAPADTFNEKQKPAGTAATQEAKKPADKIAAPDKNAAKDVEPLKPVEHKPEKNVVTTKAPAKLAAGQTAVTATRLEVGKDIIFRITGASPLKTKTLLLKDPNRFVVDLQGNWGIQLPSVPKDSWMTGIRMGQHDNITRLVFELNRVPASASVAKINDTTVEVRIK